jgi:hypothetical protein
VVLSTYDVLFASGSAVLNLDVSQRFWTSLNWLLRSILRAWLLRGSVSIDLAPGVLQMTPDDRTVASSW